jgi:MoxR-like ATPase
MMLTDSVSWDRNPLRRLYVLTWSKSMNTALQQKFVTTSRELNAYLIEREQEIRMGMCGFLARQHVFYFGGPGIAKSLIADSLAQWINGRRFKLQLNMYSTPEETIGHVSVKKMVEEDAYVRKIANKLPTAHVAFLDEPFNASSGILNSLNELLQEGTMRNDDKTIECPLQCCFGASNLTPHGRDDGEGLMAMFDRFILRRQVRSIQEEGGWHRLIHGAIDGTLNGKPPQLSTSLTLDELFAARQESNQLPFPSNVESLMHSIRQALSLNGINLSPRRWTKSVPIVRANAYINGHDQVLPSDLQILENVLWEHPVDHPDIVSATISKISCPEDHIVNELRLQAREIANRPAKTKADFMRIAEDLELVATKLKAVPHDKSAAALEYVQDQCNNALDRMMRISAVTAI